MGIATFPAAASGLTSAVRSVQRGVAATSGNITISSVDITKTICNSFSTSSAGSVAATGTLSAANGTASATSQSSASLALPVGTSNSLGSTTGTVTQVTCNWNSSIVYFTNNQGSVGATNTGAQNVSLNTTSISGGSTSLTAAGYGVYLVDATTITATGPCRYEVIEYF